MTMLHHRTAAATFGALLLTLVCAGPASSAPEQAGVSAAVRGQVQRASDAQPVGVQVVSGQPIYLADRISSGSDSGMQIMLLDQTTFTIGPDSFVKIDEFVYDPTTNVGKVTASLGKGVFRFVSGKIAQQNPSNMTVKLPVATIGIRGTMVFGRSDQNSAVVGLAGAGPDNNTGDKPAGIDVITPQGTAEIRRPGWGVIIERGKPLIVGRLPKPTVDSIYDSVAPRELANVLTTPGGGSNIVQASLNPDARAANNSSGQSTASALPSLATFNIVQNQKQILNDTTGSHTVNSNGVNGSNGSGAIIDPQTFINGLFSGFFNSLSTFGDLQSVVSGTGSFAQSNIPVFNATGIGPSIIGHYDFNGTLNFAGQSFSWGFTNINVNGAGVLVSNGSLNSDGSIFYGGQPAGNPVVFPNSGTCGNTQCQTFVLMNNAGGIAKNALHEILLTLPGQSNIAAVGAGVASR